MSGPPPTACSWNDRGTCIPAEEAPFQCSEDPHTDEGGIPQEYSHTGLGSTAIPRSTFRAGVEDLSPAAPNWPRLASKASKGLEMTEAQRGLE